MGLAIGVLVSVCPVKVNSHKFGPIPICGYSVMFMKGLLQMEGVAFVHVFNTEVVNS